MPEPDIKNEVVEVSNEEVKEDKPKRLTQKDNIQCKKCLNEMTIKSYKYSHEKNCQGQISERPVKPQTKPKAKSKPKTVQEEKEVIPKSVPKPKSVPVVPRVSNPLQDLTNHYQLLQSEFIKQKRENMHSLCQDMFNRPKKR